MNDFPMNDLQMNDYRLHEHAQETAKEPAKEAPQELARHRARAARRAAEETRGRIRGLSHKMLEGIERILDRLADDRAMPAPPVAVARRQLANMLQLSRLCANRACRRTRCCRGEPLHCLQAIVPILPQEACDNLIRKQPARRRRRA